MLLANVAGPGSAKVNAKEADSERAVLIGGIVGPKRTMLRIGIGGPNIT